MQEINEGSKPQPTEHEADIPVTTLVITSTTTTAIVSLNLSLSESFPDWRIAIDSRSGKKYYWNVKTGQSSWERPKATKAFTDLTKVPNSASEYKSAIKLGGSEPT